MRQGSDPFSSSGAVARQGPRDQQNRNRLSCHYWRTYPGIGTTRMTRTAPRQESRDARRDLSEFLRNRRSRLSPLEVGLAPGARRRTPGLRREEVAQLAGIGVTWYTWLEQGREIRVSAHFLENLARALRLSAAEREHLFALAQHRPPPLAAPPPPTISPALAR